MVTFSAETEQHEEDMCLTCIEARRFLPRRVSRGIIEENGKRYMAPCYGSEVCPGWVVDRLSRPPEEL
jgi:hypothetical protein